MRTPLLSLKHLISRGVVYFNLSKTMKELERVEKSIQARKQKLYEMEYDMKMREPILEEYYRLKGFIEGVDYCLKGEWKKDA